MIFRMTPPRSIDPPSDAMNHAIRAGVAKTPMRLERLALKIATGTSPRARDVIATEDDTVEGITIEREYRRDDSHAVVVYEEHKCIQCGNCVRACDELLDSPCMGFAGRGFSARVKPALDRQLVLINDEHLPEIVKFCPVGALTLKTDPVPVLKPMEFLEKELNH